MMAKRTLVRGAANGRFEPEVAVAAHYMYVGFQEPGGSGTNIKPSDAKKSDMALACRCELCDCV